MENNILDFEDKDKNYTKSSFIKLKAASGFFIAAIIVSTVLGRAENDLLYMILGIFVGLAILISLGLSIIGLIAGIKSYRRKEPPSSKRAAGLFGNLLIVILFSSLIVVNLIDLFRFSS